MENLYCHLQRAFIKYLLPWNIKTRFWRSEGPFFAREGNNECERIETRHFPGSKYPLWSETNGSLPTTHLCASQTAVAAQLRGESKVSSQRGQSHSAPNSRWPLPAMGHGVLQILVFISSASALARAAPQEGRGSKCNFPFSLRRRAKYQIWVEFLNARKPGAAQTQDFQSACN